MSGHDHRRVIRALAYLCAVLAVVFLAVRSPLADRIAGRGPAAPPPGADDLGWGASSEAFESLDDPSGSGPADGEEFGDPEPAGPDGPLVIEAAGSVAVDSIPMGGSRAGIAKPAAGSGAAGPLPLGDRRLRLSRTASPEGGATIRPAGSPVTDPAVLDPLMQAGLDRVIQLGRVPSAAAALIADGRIVWSGARGLANLRVKTPATPQTVYLWASTFKTLTTCALLQQLDGGKFALDDRVNDYLTELEIGGENRRYPVTFRQLLTHTSGLPTDFGRHSVWEDDGPPSLAEYLEGHLRLQRRPMTRVVYSNVAYTLIGYLVETFAGVPFKQYVRDRVFQPCEMRDTAFEPRADMAERLAIPYVALRRRSGIVYEPVDWVKADVWPAGIVYGTVLDQARWLIANLNGGVYKGRALLAPETFREMTTRQHDRFAGPLNGGWLNETTGYGLTWWVSRVNGETVIAHSGSVRGYTAFMAGNIDRGTGIAIMTNGNKAHSRLYELALNALDALGGGGE